MICKSTVEQILLQKIHNPKVKEYAESHYILGIAENKQYNCLFLKEMTKFFKVREIVVTYSYGMKRLTQTSNTSLFSVKKWVYT